MTKENKIKKLFKTRAVLLFVCIVMLVTIAVLTILHNTFDVCTTGLFVAFIGLEVVNFICGILLKKNIKKIATNQN